jgi:hypothetical protein
MTAVRRSQQAGTQLGKAAMQALQLAASHPDDPTWLAYTEYGGPRATGRNYQLPDCVLIYAMDAKYPTASARSETKRTAYI